MRVLISVVGRFHAFDLANQLQKAGMLYKLNTTYPKHITQRWGIEKENINSNVFLEFLGRYAVKWFPWAKAFLRNYITRAQAKSNKAFLKDVDVFIGWSSSSLEALIEAKKSGKVTILERGSSHYTYQSSILKDEFGRNNISFQPNYDAWQRELLEYELADFIMVPSQYVKRSFVNQGIPEKKLLLNPYGVDLRSFQKVEKKDDVFRVIYAGGLTIRKGTQYLLQAFYELDLPNSEFWHMGTVTDEVKQYVETFKSDKIKFLGQKPQKELYNYYSQGSVFVIMSLEEGLSMVQLQAMACGLPLICSTNTGGEDLITKDGEEGFVVPIRAVDVLKQRLQYLYDNPEVLSEMGKKAQLKVASGFSWDDYGDRYAQILRDIVGDK